MSLRSHGLGAGLGFAVLGLLAGAGALGPLAGAPGLPGVAALALLAGDGAPGVPGARELVVPGSSAFGPRCVAGAKPFFWFGPLPLPFGPLPLPAAPAGVTG